MKYYLDMMGDRMELKTIEDHDTVYVGTLEEAGITEDNDPMFQDKLDQFFAGLGISPDEWEIG